MPDGSGHDVPTLMVAAADYEARIRELGGVDVQVLGIGANGHLGFNEPGSALTSRTRVKRLSDRTRRDNARFFRGIDDVPTHCVTQGLGTILEARRLVLVATGDAKADAVAAALEGPLTASVPASVLQWHPDTVVCLDEAAAAALRNRPVLRRRGQRPARLTASGSRSADVHGEELQCARPGLGRALGVVGADQVLVVEEGVAGGVQVELCGRRLRPLGQAREHRLDALHRDAAVLDAEVTLHRGPDAGHDRQVARQPVERHRGTDQVGPACGQGEDEATAHAEPDRADRPARHGGQADEVVDRPARSPTARSTGRLLSRSAASAASWVVGPP